MTMIIFQKDPFPRAYHQRREPRKTQSLKKNSFEMWFCFIFSFRLLNTSKMRSWCKLETRSARITHDTNPGWPCMRSSNLATTGGHITNKGWSPTHDPKIAMSTSEGLKTVQVSATGLGSKINFQPTLGDVIIYTLTSHISLTCKLSIEQVPQPLFS